MPHTNGIKLSGKRPYDARNGLGATLVARRQGRFCCGYARPEAPQDPYLNAIGATHLIPRSKPFSWPFIPHSAFRIRT